MPSLRDIREEFRQLGSGLVEFDPNFSPGVGLISLRNPDRHNALCGRMMAELADIVDRLEEISQAECNSPNEDALIGLILAGGDNRSFCAGLDLGVAKDHILEPESGAKMSSLMQDTLFRLRRLPLISIAAIEGHALGGGAELTTACDFRCLAKSAKVRFVQVKMATTPGWGGGSRLVEIVGRTRALKLLGTSELLTSHYGLEIGFVDAIADHGEAITKSVHFLDGFVYSSSSSKEGEVSRLKNSVKAVRGMKQIIAATETPESVRNLEHSLFCGLWGAEENKRAILGPNKN